jgi:preprotein translocase subunit SecG
MLISILHWLSMILLLVVGLLLMGIILLQRGRGGGLAGAFGGMGGQSAFGTKAGDVFTKITIVMAVIWVLLAGTSKFFLEAAANRRAGQIGDTRLDDTPAVEPDEDAPPTRPAAPEDSPARTTPGGSPPQTPVAPATSGANGAGPAAGEAAPADDTQPPATAPAANGARGESPAPAQPDDPPEADARAAEANRPEPEAADAEPPSGAPGDESPAPSP